MLVFRFFVVTNSMDFGYCFSTQFWSYLEDPLEVLTYFCGENDVTDAQYMSVYMNRATAPIC